MVRSVAAAVAAILVSAAPAAGQVTGWAVALSGDTLMIGPDTFRLFGIDALEPLQLCYIDGREWACGAVATRSLELLTGLQPATCRPTGDSAGDEGVWAICDVGGADMAEAVVSDGMALALRDQTEGYVAAEAAARAANVGVWRSHFLEPWVYRTQLAAVEEAVRTRAVGIAASEGEASLKEGAALMPFGDAVVTVAASEASLQVVAAPRLAAGFVTDAVHAVVFNWTEPSQAMAVWRDKAVAAIVAKAVAEVWLGLRALPQREVTVDNATALVRVLSENARPLAAAGRRPVLIVPARDEPVWISELVGTSGAGIQPVLLGSEPVYISAVNGVRIFTGPTPGGQMLFFASDILSGINYAPDAEGAIVAAVETPVTDGAAADQSAFGFRQTLQWRPDAEVLVIRYPFIPLEERMEGE